MAHSGLFNKKVHHQQQQKHTTAKHEAGIRAAAASAKQHMHDPAIKQVVTSLSSSGAQETKNYTVGSLVFGGLLFAAGAAAWTLPWLFVLFAFVCLPWRAYSFCKQKWVSTIQLLLSSWLGHIIIFALQGHSTDCRLGGECIRFIGSSWSALQVETLQAEKHFLAAHCLLAWGLCNTLLCVWCSLLLQAFYLIDFCYFVNALVVIHLLFFPNNTGLEALAYALSDGPLAGALVAWQCPWVFGSAEHTTRWVEGGSALPLSRGVVV